MRNTLVLVMAPLIALMIAGCNSDNAGKPTAESLYRQGQALETKSGASRQDFSEARDTYSQALQSSPSPAMEARIHAGLANASYWLDDYPTAMTEWTEAYPKLEDANAKSFALYRIGLCQQRMGQFAQADETFAKVQQDHSGTDAAQRAREHQGYKAFTVQLATYANSKTADTEIAKLRQSGVTPAKGVNSKGLTVVSIGPAQTYAQAMDLKNRFVATYPQAIILPEALLIRIFSIGLNSSSFLVSLIRREFLPYGFEERVTRE